MSMNGKRATKTEREEDTRTALTSTLADLHKNTLFTKVRLATNEQEERKMSLQVP